MFDNNKSKKIENKGVLYNTKNSAYKSVALHMIFNMIWVPDGINYPHAKFQVNILKNKLETFRTLITLS